MSGVVTREQLVVQLAAQILALDESAPRAVALTGMSCAGKTTLAAEVAAVVDGAGRPVVPVAYDDFHHPRERRYRLGRTSAEGYLDDSFDPDSLSRLVLDPVAAGGPSVVPAAYDLAGDVPVDRAPVPVAAGSVVLVEGSFLLVPALAGRWDLSVFVVADAERVLERAVVRDADLGTPAEVREMYLRRYLAAESMHQERDDPWSHADVVVDLTDPAAPRLLS
ncbi:MAG: uridine kinase [Actinomycetota bacterium]|jgi:uridine kinase|nr:uridine kinase [Actinomycetota bacterium]